MKYFFLACVAANACLVSPAQKKLLEHSDYNQWPRIDNSSISNNGRYVSYTLGSPKTGYKSIIQSVDEEWKMEIPNVYSVTITGDSKFAIYSLPNDSIAILSLEKKSAVYISDAISYKVPVNNNQTWLAYFTRNRVLVIYDLKRGEQKRYVGVAGYFVSEDGSAIIIEKQSADKPRLYNLYWIDKLSFTENLFWTGDTVVNLTFDKTAGQIAFIAAAPDTIDERYSLWHFKKNTANARLKVNDIVDTFSVLKLINGRLEFSDDGSKLFFGILCDKKNSPLNSNPGFSVEVDIWSYQDEYLQPQLLRSDERGKYFTGVFNIAGDTIFTLNKACDHTTLLNKSRNQRFALICSEYNAEEMSWKPSARPSWYLVSLEDGKRRRVVKNLLGYNDAAVMSPTGRFVIYYDPVGRSYCSYDVKNGITKNISSRIPVKLYDEEHDEPRPAPNYGIAAWSSDDSLVLIYDKFDVWKVDPTGNSEPVNVTAGYGRDHNIVFRLVSFGNNLDIPIISLSDSLLLVAFDRDNNQNGFYLLRPAYGNPTKLIMDSCIFYLPQLSISSAVNVITPPLKARDVKAYVLQRRSTSSAPNLLMTRDFKSLIPVTDIQPQNSYNWMTSELIRWNLPDGTTAKGILYKPENFDSGKKYPIIFYLYERMSDGLNRYIYPEASTGALNIPYFVSNGYLVFIPDIYFQIGYTGESACHAVISAAKFLSRKKWVNAQRMGLQGHSFGGYEVNYIITKTNLFAAASSSAGVSDFVSFYGAIRNESGVNGQSLFETGQNRIGGTLWTKKKLFIKNSPIFYANMIETPLLLMHNKKDGAVPWEQSVELFNALRRLEKKVWLLQYNRGGHQLVEDNASLDFTIRMAQFFNHYLKGDRAPEWMIKGVSATGKRIAN